MQFDPVLVVSFFSRFSRKIDHEGGSAPTRKSPPHPKRINISLYRLVVILLVVGFVAVMPWQGSAQAEPPKTAEELMRMVDDLWRGKNSHAKMTMTVKTKRYERTLKIEAWSEGTEKSLMQILAPKKDRGVATLKVEKNIWNYLPKVNRVTKIPASMMMGSWMGSHFTNDDLVKESSFEKDYMSELSFTGSREGKEIYEVTSMPRPEAAVVWGKVVTIVTQKDLLPVKALYYDEEGVLARELVFLEPKQFGSRTVPAVLRLTSTEKPGEHTTVRYDSLTYDLKLPVDLFSLRRLRSGR